MTVDIGFEPIELVRMDWYVRQYAVAHFRGPAYLAKVLRIPFNRIAVMIAHHQLLDTVKSRKGIERIFAEQHVTQVPDRVMLTNDTIPTMYQFVIVFLHSRERPCYRLELTDLFVAEVCIGNNEYSIRHTIDFPSYLYQDGFRAIFSAIRARTSASASGVGS